jgi:hypothetical protein
MWSGYPILAFIWEFWHRGPEAALDRSKIKKKRRNWFHIPPQLFNVKERLKKSIWNYSILKKTHLNDHNSAFALILHDFGRPNPIFQVSSRFPALSRFFKTLNGLPDVNPIDMNSHALIFWKVRQLKNK